MSRREIQSVEVSCLIHATEDGERVKDSIMAALSLKGEAEEEVLEGHFGNGIVHASWHLTGEEAWEAFGKLMEIVGAEGRAELLRDFSSVSDERGALYLRLNKQLLVKGLAVFSASDPVRVRVKPRGFMMKGSPQQFYQRLLRREPR